MLPNILPKKLNNVISILIFVFRIIQFFFVIIIFCYFAEINRVRDEQEIDKVFHFIFTQG